MVERPADVLRMDKAAPVKMDGFGRLDMTIRKTPGFGLFICFGLIEIFRQVSGWLLLGFLAMVAAALLDEYGPDVIRRFISRPRVAPSQPSA